MTLELLDDLTHEFLQILERTPSKLKRIRNWRAFQNSKKPKTEGASVESAFPGTSSLNGLSSSFFPSSSDSSEMPSLSSLTAPYASYQPMDAAKACGYDQFSQPLHSDFALIKQEPKSSKHQQIAVNGTAFSRPQKVLTLDKYREKHAPELALQNGIKTETEMYPALSPIAPSHHHHHHHHKKRSQAHPSGQTGDSRREKSSSKKPKTSHNLTENGSATSEELKMRIKVSSDAKDKHKDHHRHSKHSHQYAVNGRGAMDSLTLRATAAEMSAVSSRKRPHSDGGNHNNHHHSSKSSRSSKASLNSHFSDVNHGHDGTNGLLGANGQHTDYKNTFDMLDSLLSAQGMNL